MAETGGIGLSKVGQVALTVGDLEKAKDFYGRALGLKPLFAMERLAFYDCGNLRLMLSLPEAGFKPGVAGTVLYFKVEACREAEKALVSRGVTFEQPPHLIARMDSHDLWMGFFRDPDGNPLAIMSEEVPRSEELPGAQARADGPRRGPMGDADLKMI